MRDFSVVDYEAEPLSLEERYQQKKKKIWMNLIEFVVGVVLLIFCLNYLSNHPAEKSSIITGIEVVMQKAKILFSQRTTGQGEALQRKFELERSFKELLFMGEEGECMTEADLRKLQTYLEQLEVMDAMTFERQEYSYRKILSSYYEKGKEACESITTDGSDAQTNQEKLDKIKEMLQEGGE